MTETIVTRIVTRIALVTTLLALVQGFIVTPPAFAASGAPQPNHAPNTLKQFRASGTATGKQNSGVNTAPALKNAGPMDGTPPDKAPVSASAVDLKPVDIALDTPFLATSATAAAATAGAGVWTSSSDGVIDIQVAPNSVDLSAATVNGAPIGPIAPPPAPTTTPASTTSPTPTTTPTPTVSSTATPSSSATPGATPGAPPQTTPGATPAVAPSATTAASAAQITTFSTQNTPAQNALPTPGATAPASSFTLELKQIQGTYRGDGMQLGAYTLHVLDGSQRELGNVRLRAPIQIRFHYGTEDLSGVNAADLRLVWPATGNEQAKKPAQSVPLTLDPQAHTLTATVSTIFSGPMLMAASLSDANAASSEHVLVAGNTGDLNDSVPLTTPPAAGGLAPNLTLTYSSASTNGRSWRGAPAPWTGDGWDLSFGSISYDAVTGLFYLNGVAGENEALLCCVVDGSHGNINYFMAHHNDTLHITT
ncbi:MAG TPA: hypothetical protein VID72_11915, partial [Ktedonobacterales bacterium]